VLFPTSRREGRRSVGVAQVEEDGLHDGRIDEEGGILISPPHAGHRSGSTS
jgi:hypothetical protein